MMVRLSLAVLLACSGRDDGIVMECCPQVARVPNAPACSPRVGTSVHGASWFRHTEELLGCLLDGRSAVTIAPCKGRENVGADWEWIMSSRVDFSGLQLTAKPGLTWGFPVL